MRLVFAVPYIDREDLVFEVFGELFVLFGVPSDKWVDIERHCQAAVEDLFNCGLARGEQTQLIILYEVVFLG